MPGGPSGGSWPAWPYLPGFGGLVADWSKAGQQSYWWVCKSFSSLWAKAQTALATGGSAWACDQTGTYIFDGGTHGSIAFPVVRTAVRLSNGINSYGLSMRARTP
jgi:hypothetical protein